VTFTIGLLLTAEKSDTADDDNAVVDRDMMVLLRTMGEFLFWLMFANSLRTGGTANECTEREDRSSMVIIRHSSVVVVVHSKNETTNVLVFVPFELQTHQRYHT
jgi:hypothetical protein